MAGTGNRFVSAQQVAEYAGVSRSAVSRTFTEGASVSAKTREKVLAAAQELGYHVNHLARGLHDTSNIVSLITTDINSPFQSAFIDELTQQLQKINKIALVVNTKANDEDVDTALTQTLNFRAEASIVLSGQPHKDLIDKCIANGQHVILVNRNQVYDNAYNIRLDNHAAAFEALAILQQQGCKNLLLVNSDIGSPGLVAREKGFVDAANKAGLSVSVSRFGDTSYESGKHIAKQLKDIPDGVFCVTDLLACGFIDGLKQQGIEIPKHTVVIGFDDINQASWDAYQLTTFRQPLTSISQHIIQCLQANNTVLNGEFTYLLEPVWRKTTRHN
ncbi:LacI family transcriptional regulator [Photobacterium rosenbergii]|uniref:LacI family transcriptional regulator n=1 Tax=Photobacterium rosenbergii TaxID=294936 RepID=A0A2T3NJI4_9GAMM|nr:substrate-binding domain-containing protein [Photobacterium rosenbergii]PSW15684.1 LacI family transcriptional regulator [Photobacterium rosenbergii]